MLYFTMEAEAVRTYRFLAEDFVWILTYWRVYDIPVQLRSDRYEEMQTK